ncbi:GTP 3',8-cyclase MoaA [Aggregatilinea lenta]|uniref:GTP 3',8-cyclase MoaA n=1 Tax=Aggregatilinea lenta TaxID=913108 RepID=UPI000E5C0EB6|nr:GTP 3',8-cyclase MoaA [Aggregatilinea lenta]
MGPNITDTLHRPLRDLRISVTDRCNFRCRYCMPAEIYGEHYRFMPKAEMLSFEEIARLVRIMAGFGVEKIRLTGGEPLVRQQLEKLVEQIAAIDGIDDIAITTNGVLLPQKIQALKDAGLKRVTISLDSLDNDVFRRMNGERADVQQVLDGIAAAQQAGFAPIKINSVAQRGVNDHTLVDLARYCRDNGLILRFIEYMDVGTLNGWKLDQVVPAREIIERIGAEIPLEPIEPNYRGEVASRYRYADGSGEIGVIASVTQPFCGTCTRLRLTPEGNIYTCLFAVQGTELRDLLRSGAPDEAIADRIRGVWQARADRYSEIRSSLTDLERPKVEMYHIGG